ncbi:MAG TPA: DUF4019 domain-containing protein [Rhizomicrobium sp.]|nr:DUF4019 domain-containing protein [Rhizomicrobium sp.]
MVGRLSAWGITVALCGCLSFGGFAQSAPAPDAAARQWLFYVDGGDYAKGWDRAGSPFRTQISAPVLQSKIAPVREPLGAILERRLFRVTYSNTAPGLPEGKYAAVQFSSRFANKPAAGETVWLNMEKDRWAVIGYFIGPEFATSAGSGARDHGRPDAKGCTREEQARARIARMNGYTGGPKCNLPE